MNKKCILLIISTAIISGFSVFINKFGVSLSNPYVFTFLKNIVVVLILTGIILFLKEFKILRELKVKQWLTLVLIGLIGGCIPFLLFFKGLSMTSAAQGSFIQKTMFIYVAILALIFLKEKFAKNFLIGALILLLGSIFALKSLKFSFGYGDLLVLIATLFWAAENVLSKYALRNLPSKTVAWGRMFFGSIFISAFLVSTGQARLITSFNLNQIIWILITSIMLFGYVFTWYSGLKHVPVSTATAILLLGSPITTALSVISTGKINLQETISIILIVAGLAIIIGFGYMSDLKNKLFTLNFKL